MRLRAALAALLFLTLAAPPAHAWPDRPVTVIVPFAAGSPFDIVARLMAPGMAERLGQPVVIQNIAGAGGSIGVDRAVRATDGHTMVLSGDAVIVVRPSMQPPLSFDPARELAPVLQVGVTPNVLVVLASSPVQTLADLIALARAQPGTMAYGNPGPGTSIQIASEMLRQMAGFDATSVAYAQTPQLLQDLLAGRLTFNFGNVLNYGPAIRDGRVRVLGTSSPRRLATMPEVPTIAEQGFPGFDAVAWTGYLMPARTPPAVVDQAFRAANATLADPAVGERLRGLGMEITGLGPADFVALIARETVRMGGVVRAANIRAE